MIPGWAFLAGFVLGYDAFAAATGHRTLTGEFRLARERRPLAVALVSFYVLSHLYGVWPSQYDPLHFFTFTWEQLHA